MDKNSIKSLIESTIKDNKDRIEISIENRAKIVINIKRIRENDYLTTTKYILDNNEIHFATLRELIERPFVDDINKYFEEDIWTSTSVHGKNNKDGILELVFELSTIDVMDIIMHPKYQYNQWQARNPYVNYQLTENGKLSGYQKNYQEWYQEGIDKGFIDIKELNGFDNLEVIDEYVHCDSSKNL